ncbi:hypothetical protein OQA88_5749 [Cercophora sp. LCS_1]
MPPSTQTGGGLLRRACTRPRTQAWNARQHAALWVALRRHHAAVVVGAGPAGIAAVGNLLEHLPADAGKIAWVDSTGFSAGDIRRYGEVPSNTKAALFLQYARALEPFRQICDASPEPNPVRAIEALDQEKTCSLGLAGNMLRYLTNGLTSHERIEATPGFVTGARWLKESSQWQLDVAARGPSTTGVSAQISSPLVVYCIGAKPNYLPGVRGAHVLPISRALSPKYLASNINPDKPKEVLVIGGSHTAILVLKNLCNLAWTTHPKLTVKWATRSRKLKYAVQQDGWILYDNTGLKGEAADFAREYLDGDKVESSDASRVITKVVDLSQPSHGVDSLLVEATKRDQLIVQAIGFTPRQLPRGSLDFNHETGQFMLQPGLYGAGIGFPERMTDPAGNVEYAVGFWKFMRFLKRVVPEWVAAHYPNKGA